MTTTPLEKAVDDFVHGLSLQRLREYAFNHILDEYRYNTISNDKLLNDFINGKYSKLSGQYKIDILRFHNQPLEGEIGQILYKDPHRKQELEEMLGMQLDEETELLSIINIEEETFKIKNYV